MYDTNIMTIDNVERQERYVQDQEKKGQGLGIVFADAFLRGMRDIGYKNPAWVLAEQIDNAIQAGASTVAIRLGYRKSNKTQVKPDMIAVCDNGNGMIPKMISYAVRWGGTDREGDRTGFGRYGYGLPSSAVALAKRYTVYSKTKGNDWHAVTVDIDKLADVAGDVNETAKLLTAQPASPPTWVTIASGDDNLDLTSIPSGTIIILEDADRLEQLGGWKKAETLRTKLLQHFGAIYRHLMPERRIFVDGIATQVVDPLFLMEHGRFFDETRVHAEKVETRTFEVMTSRKTKGKVRIRAAVLPPHFQLADPAEYGVKEKGNKTNNRLDIMKMYNGLLICREGRHIDTINPRWTKFQTYDANIKIEINFDPELDEFFGLTTAKQQIVLTEEMWEKLQHSGKEGGALKDLVKTMRARFEELQNELKAKAQNVVSADTQRPSALAMEESEKFKGTVQEPTPAQQETAVRNLEEFAAGKAETTGQPKEDVLKELAEQTKKRRWEVEFLPIPEGPFYRPVALGEQKRLVINTDHPFFPKIFERATPDVRAALEVVLFVLAERELEVSHDAATFYKAERQRWSERLRHALDTLVADETIVNTASMIAETMHTADESAA
jgi:hypothetical protein